MFVNTFNVSIKRSSEEETRFHKSSIKKLVQGVRGIFHFSHIKNKKNRFGNPISSSSFISASKDNSDNNDNKSEIGFEDPYTTYGLLEEPVFFDDDEDDSPTTSSFKRKRSLDSDDTFYSARSNVTVGGFGYRFEPLENTNSEY